MVTLQEFFKAAVQDVGSGQYAEAIRKLELIMTHKIGADDKSKACVLLGGAHLVIGNNEHGVRRLKEALSVAPINFEA